MIRLKSLLFEQQYRTSIDAMEPLVAQIAQQFGETIAQFAGGGANGKAWILQSGKVLKLTADATEIKTAEWKKSKGQSKHIVGYYDIRQIINIHPDNIDRYGPVYAIIMDGVTTLTTQQKEWYNALFMKYFDYQQSDSEFINIVNNQMLSSVPGFVIFWNNLISQRRSVLADLRRANIHTGECHSGNVGFDRKTPTQFRVFDTWREKSFMKGVIKTTRTIDYDILINNKPDSSGIDTPNNLNM
jgi:hypothetical protein